MYAGRIVEENDVVSIFEQPRHPYTRALLESVPSFRHRGKPLATIPGRVPSLAALPAGCKFSNRCAYAQAVCERREPALLDDGHGRVRCVMYDPASGYEATGG
jgi:oligopeptide/dipeptide ABC transporter ATP-binding protein